MNLHDHRTGIEMIAEERNRQILEEHYDGMHDDDHDEGELVRAAVCYAANKTPYEFGEFLFDNRDATYNEFWPWDDRSDKREKHDRVKSLAIAGALIAAEIDREMRKARKDPV